MSVQKRITDRIRKLPRPGQRIWRSVCAVWLCFAVYFLRGQEGIPFYSALAVLQCMQPYQESSVKMARQRTVGTLVGAAFGLPVILVERYVFHGGTFGSFPYYFVITLLAGFVIYTTVLLNIQNTAYFSTVVFLSITVNHVGDANPCLFAFNRVVDTMLGVVLALAVNSFHLPRRRRTDVLFVSGVDDTILTGARELTAYSRVELNRLIEQGMHFTVSTRRTPANIRETLSGVKLKLPIIVMDGAALYDMERNAYLRTVQMNAAKARRMSGVLEAMGVSCFTNIVVEDLLVICYRELSNEAQKKIYEKMHRSPYRNYVRRPLMEEEGVVYFMLIEERARAQELYGKLSAIPKAEDYRLLMYDSGDYPGYTYIKIFDCTATRGRMLSELCSLLGMEKTVTFGSIEGKYDVYIRNSDKNETVRELKKQFEPLIWEKKADW